MSVINEVRETFKNQKIGTEFTTKEIKEMVSYKFGTKKGSVNPSDYSYNMTNKGKIGSLKHFNIFIQIETGLFRYVGENYNAQLNNKNQTKAHTKIIQKTKKSNLNIDIPTPCKEEVEKYLDKWSNLENYHLQEDALNKLFHQLCPNNTDITDILIKASTLNDFYSTNIMSIYPVAKHILSLNIDSRLQNGDISLVDEIKRVQMNNKIINNYSFATKYCSHHNSLDYPIYDSYVDEILRYFRNTDNFSKFSNDDLKNYAKFKTILIDFKSFYNLDEYNLKQIDQYLWQLGKEHFNKYKK